MRYSSWVLLWLLPYLFLNVAGESLHNHPLLPGRAAPASTSVASGHTWHGQPALERTDSADCLACQWASSSTACLLADTVAPVARALAVASTGLFLSPGRSSSLTALSRGPPLS